MSTNIKEEVADRLRGHMGVGMLVMSVLAFFWSFADSQDLFLFIMLLSDFLCQAFS